MYYTYKPFRFEDWHALDQTADFVFTITFTVGFTSPCI